MLFGEKLRAERKKLGVATKIFAKMCGVSRSYVTLIENNKRLPGKKLLPRIAIALQLEKKVMLNWYLENISHRIQNAETS